MAKTKSYNHCLLVKKEESCERTKSVWIPSQLAEVGMPLKVEGEDGWLVKDVGDEQPADRVEKWHNIWKKHREKTDLPKGTFKGKMNE